jgi:hypothetical protein
MDMTEHDLEKLLQEVPTPLKDIPKRDGKSRAVRKTKTSAPPSS